MSPLITILKYFRLLLMPSRILVPAAILPFIAMMRAITNLCHLMNSRPIDFVMAASQVMRLEMPL